MLPIRDMRLTWYTGFESYPVQWRNRARDSIDVTSRPEGSDYVPTQIHIDLSKVRETVSTEPRTKFERCTRNSTTRV